MDFKFAFGLGQIVRDTRSKTLGRVVRCVVFGSPDAAQQLFAVQGGDPENAPEAVPPEFLEAIED